MCCSTRAECYLFLLCAGCAAMSVLAAVPMFILTHPGDECLLFVSVRGEALIYGNPAGCNFVAYSHCVVIAGIVTMLVMLFCRRRKGFPKRPRESASNRTLPGSSVNGNGNGVPTFTANPFGNGVATFPDFSRGLGVAPSASMNTVAAKRFARLYSAKVLLLCGVLAAFVAVTAVVIVSGYVVSCGELQYETRRQLYGRTTLGVPIKDLNIACWSVFRDVDFHSRFHFDHYEYSGQWHGQFRGYKHGRVHQYSTNKHRHLIGVATALEMSIAGSTIGAMLWILLLMMLIYLRVHQKQRQSRELAASIEDARIYASSRDNMELTGQGKRLPADQSSVTSNQSSSILSQKPDYLTNPNGAVTPSTVAASYAQMSRASSAMGSGTGPYAQINRQPQASDPNAVQYVQLSNGVIVPMTNDQLQGQQQQQQQLQQRQLSQQSVAYAQLQTMQAMAASQAAAAASAVPAASTASNARPVSTISSASQQAIQQQQQLLAQQQLQLQQLMQQQQMLQQQQQQQQLSSQQLSPQLSANLSPIQQPAQQQQQQRQQQSLPRTSSSVRTSMVVEQDEQDGQQQQQQVPNNKSAQRAQVHLSKDIGMKCSQI